MFKKLMIAALALSMSAGAALAVAETLTGTRAEASFPVFKPSGSGLMAVATGSYAVAANVEDGDIFELLKIPAGACVVGGYFYADDLDTNGSETIDLDVGWAANGSDAADPIGFGNFGIMNGDAVTNVRPEAANMYALFGVLKDGVKCFVRETTIQVEANDVAATFAAGDITVTIFYYVP